jgi:hypothetical protein
VVADLGQHHLGGHVRGRVQAVDGHLGGGNTVCHLEARHDLSQLALVVGARLPASQPPADDGKPVRPPAGRKRWTSFIAQDAETAKATSRSAAFTRQRTRSISCASSMRRSGDPRGGTNYSDRLASRGLHQPLLPGPNPATGWYVEGALTPGHLGVPGKVVAIRRKSRAPQPAVVQRGETLARRNPAAHRHRCVRDHVTGGQRGNRAVGRSRKNPLSKGQTSNASPMGVESHRRRAPD